MKVEHENFQFLIWVCENPLVTERVDSGISYGGLGCNGFTAAQSPSIVDAFYDHRTFTFSFAGVS